MTNNIYPLLTSAGPASVLPDILNDPYQLLTELIVISQATQDILITGILVIVLLLVAILITKLI